MMKSKQQVKIFEHHDYHLDSMPQVLQNQRLKLK